MTGFGLMKLEENSFEAGKWLGDEWVASTGALMAFVLIPPPRKES